MSAPRQLYDVSPTGELRLHFHVGQRKAWASDKRIIAVIAGAQSGKTSFSPIWLYREIQQRGSGDYLVASPSFALMSKSLLPAYRRYFERVLRLGELVGSPSLQFRFSQRGSKRTFGTSDPCTIHFGHAANPDSLESMTAKAAVLDEAGQAAFKQGSWEAINRRVAINQGRILLPTTPYHVSGWLKEQVYDPGVKGDAEIEVVNFDSTENPAFPREEFERARRLLPSWKFDLFYRGIFTRPAGLIYDSFDDAAHICAPFAIPTEWPRYLGIDFGGVNTAACFYAQAPDGKLYLYRTYHAGQRTAKEHVKHLLEGEPGIKRTQGGSKSEGQWRAEFRAAGLLVHEPDQPDVEVGITRVYGAHRSDAIIVFSDQHEYLKQKRSYSRELDDSGEPTEAIADKGTYHLMDAERYIISHLMKEKVKVKMGEGFDLWGRR